MTFSSAFIFVCGAATGALVYDVALERQQPLRWSEPSIPRAVAYCPPANKAGHALTASMIQESYIAGADKAHDCVYR